jgi:hypothetical protein
MRRHAMRLARYLVPGLILAAAGVAVVLVRGMAAPPVPASDPSKGWGLPSNDIAFKVRPVHDRYVLGEDVKLVLWVRNVGKGPIRAAGPDLRDVRIVVLDERGRYVKRSAAAEELNSQPDLPYEIGSAFQFDLQPQQSQEFQANLSQWVAIDKPGLYRIVAMYGADSVDSLAIADVATVRIVAKKTPGTQPPTPPADGGDANAPTAP